MDSDWIKYVDVPHGNRMNMNARYRVCGGSNRHCHTGTSWQSKPFGDSRRVYSVPSEMPYISSV